MSAYGSYWFCYSKSWAVLRYLSFTHWQIFYRSSGFIFSYTFPTTKNLCQNLVKKKILKMYYAHQCVSHLIEFASSFSFPLHFLTKVNFGKKDVDMLACTNMLICLKTSQLSLKRCFKKVSDRTQLVLLVNLTIKTL